MSGFDFKPFAGTCPTLSVSQNALCSAVFEFVENNAQIYTSQRSYIEKNLMKKIKQGKFNAIQACKAFENMLIAHKKYIVEELNKIQSFKNKYDLTTKKLNKDIRREISCLFVNNFLSDYEQEIKRTLGIKDDSDDESIEYDGKSDICSDCDEIMPANCKCDEKEIVIEKDVIFISSSKNGTSKYCDDCGLDINDECKCNDTEDEPEEIQHLKEVEELKNKIDELGDFESKYREEVYYHNDTKEALKGATEIINGHKHIEQEANDEIKKLKIINKKIKENAFEKETKICDQIRTLQKTVEDLQQEKADDKIYINDCEENFFKLVQEHRRVQVKLEEQTKEKEKEIVLRCKLMEVFKKVCDEKAKEQQELEKLKKENAKMKRMITKRQTKLLAEYMNEKNEICGECKTEIIDGSCQHC